MIAVVFVALLGCSEERPRRDAAGVEVPTPEPVAPVRIDPPAAGGASSPGLVADGTRILASWVEPGDAGRKRVRVATLEGDRWSAATTIVEDAAVLSNFADVPAVLPVGETRYATWSELVDAETEAIRIRAARSFDGGAWAPLGTIHDDAAPSEHGFASLVADGDAARAFWLDGREMPGGGPMTLRTARLDGSVGASERVDARVCECCGTAAAATPDGPIVVYRDRTEEEIRDPWALRRAGEGWSAPAPVHVDGWRVPGCPVNGPAVSARGRDVVVAWFTYADARARVSAAFSGDGGASFGAPVVVAEPRGRRSPVGRVGAAWMGGDAVVSWLESERERGTIRLRRVSPEGSAGGEVEIAETTVGRESGFPRIVAAGDRIVVAWTEPGEPTHVRASTIPFSALSESTPEPVSAPDERAAPLAVGSAAPAYAVTDLAGAPASLEASKGRPILLNVWATWCEPCRQELPELVRLHESFGARGLSVVGVTVDAEKSAEEIRAFVERRRIPFAIWRDPTDLASSAFGIGSLPVTLLFDRDGRVAFRADGAIRAQDAALVRALGSVLQPAM